jgi:lipoyl(octanoyl) transferase
MKNKKIILRDIGKSSFSDAWEYQEDIFKKIIDQKIKNRSNENKMETNNFLIITEHEPCIYYWKKWRYLKFVIE